MNFNDSFFDTNLKNVDRLNEMIVYLNKIVSNRINENSSTFFSKKKSYFEFTKGKTLSFKGKAWEEVFNEFSRMFDNCVLWQSPYTMINITPPPNIPSVAAACYSMIFNPNFATDESSGFLMSSEILAIRYLLQLVEWDDNSNGIFTFGGKGTNLYALRLGLKNAVQNSISDGINAKECVVFTNDKSHPCHIELATWMGIPRSNIIVLNTDVNGTIDENEFGRKLEKCILSGKKIACIYLNGGTTNEGYIDPIKKIVNARDLIVSKYNLNYSPHIHVDSVIGWSWLFFKDYDFYSNPLNMTSEEKLRIKRNVELIKDVKFADSLGADFHKTGFCPYISSAFLVKDRKKLEEGWHCDYSNKSMMNYGDYTPFEYSLELTRSSVGPVAAYVSMEYFGIEGYQQLIYNLFHSSEIIRNLMLDKNDFILLNPCAYGLSTLFLVNNRNIKTTISDILSFNNEEIDELIEYNRRFLHYIKNYSNSLRFSLTYSKSFKLGTTDIKLGALKMFQMSPIVSNEKWSGLIDELQKAKKFFDLNDNGINKNYKTSKDLTYYNENN